ncbi:MAG: glycosyltransferase family 2 protein [Candidatus Omnitrophota bacterium]
MTKLSIIVPTYNCAKYINEAIESILNQSFKDYEIIVVDDGSTDNTKDALSPYIEKGLIKYIYQENQGPGAARNTGINQAQGKYICFLDSDDVLLENSLLKRVDFLEKYSNLDMLFTDYICENANSRNARLKSLNFMNKLNNSIEYKDNGCLIFNSNFYNDYLKFTIWPIWTGTVMLKKNIINDIGMFRTDISIAEDVDFWIRIIRKYKVGFINEALSCYKTMQSNLTKNYEQYIAKGAQLRIAILNDELKNNKMKQIDSVTIKIIKNKIFLDYLELGRHYLRNLKIKQARNAFLDSIRYRQLPSVAYLLLLASLLPISAQIKLRKLKAYFKDK